MAYTTINKPSDYFNTLTYAGNDASPRSVTGVGFKPDFTWIKNRTQAGSSALNDSVRGVGTGVFKEISSEGTGAEGTNGGSGYGYLNAFNADGFSLTTGSVGIDVVNKAGSNYVAWNWLASGTTAVANTAGTISSTVSVNQTAGFSIVSFTGNGSNSATVGHGLSVAPKMIIEKSRTASFDGSWWVFHKNMGTGSLRLNTTDGTSTAYPSGYINNSPTSSTFSFTAGSGGTVNNVNYSGDAYIAYCFAEIKGFSKFGSYTGNGSDDGTFVYTGFKPEFVLMKRTVTGDNWLVKDSIRDSFNVANKRIIPNQNSVEDTSVNGAIDLLSNGFKHRSSNDMVNPSGELCIYMAFAEQPLVGTNNVPCTAR
jgi:hypothetical protein